MNFIISGKNIEVTPGLKDAIEQKLGKLERHQIPLGDSLTKKISR